MANNRIRRRRFLTSAAGASGAAAAFTIVPRWVLGGPNTTAPSEKVTLAAVGVGDQGKRDLKTFLGREEVRVVAVCDVDEANKAAARDAVAKAYGGGRACAAFRDYRELLASQKDLDAVLCVTPDHTHAVVAAAAMKAGKHVYLQKPMTHSVHEARVLAQIAREKKVATQLGTVNQAGEGRRILQEWIEAGCIAGDMREGNGVEEVHIWSNRPFWPQGMGRPSDTPPVPPGLDWDLWLGPAPHRPYHPAYLPLVWRGWRDFGTGALGDMGCYAFDAIFRVLGLSHPQSVEGSGSGLARKMWDRPRSSDETYPQASLIVWTFAMGNNQPPVRITWYDGGLRPARPAGMAPQDKLADEGMMLIGAGGLLLCSFTGDRPQLFRSGRRRPGPPRSVEPPTPEFKPPAPRLPRSIGHHAEWTRACRGGEPAGANFDFSARVTESLLLGNVALRFPGQALRYDPQRFEIAGNAEATALLQRQYREGWTL